MANLSILKSGKAKAYASLFIYYPGHVTSYHKKMLLKVFKTEKIDELNKLIEEQIA